MYIINKIWEIIVQIRNMDIYIIDDMEYSSVDIYGVIIITGKDRGKRTFVRHRNIIMSRGRKPDITDIESSNNGGYYIAEIWPNIHLVI
jgi:hypothetical protein